MTDTDSDRTVHDALLPFHGAGHFALMKALAGAWNRLADPADALYPQVERRSDVIAEPRLPGLREATNDRLCIDGLCFTVGLVALQRKVAQVPWASWLLARLGERNSSYGSDIHALRDRLAQRLRLERRKGPLGLPTAVAPLLAHANARLRLGAVLALEPREPGEAALLRQAAMDREPSVRELAREKMTSLPSWLGLFDEDPTTSHGPAPGVAPETLAALAALLGAHARGRHDPAHAAALIEVLARLPEQLAAEAAGRWVTTWTGLLQTDVALVGFILGRPGGPAVIGRLLRDWEANALYDYEPQKAMKDALPTLSPEAREALVQALLGLATPPRTPEARAAFTGRRRHRLSVPEAAASVLAVAWPAGRDASALIALFFDWLQVVGEGAEDRRARIRHDLAAVFGRGDAIEARAAFMARLQALDQTTLEADAASLVRRLLEPKVRPAPTTRAEALEVLADPDLAARYRTAALGVLTGAGHDPAQDGPLPARIAELWATPEGRTDLMRTYELIRRALPLVRIELREGRADYEVAAAALHAIGRLFGGVTPPAHRFDKELEGPRYLGYFAADTEPSLIGPPVPEEWRRYRELRAAAFADPAWVKEVGMRVSLLDVPYPEGPFDPEDAAFIADRLRETDDEAWGCALVFALDAVEHHGHAAELALLSQLDIPARIARLDLKDWELSEANERLVQAVRAVRLRLAAEGAV